MNPFEKARARRIVIVTLQLVIALVLVVGPGRTWSGTARAWYFSYFADLVLPFGEYFLLYLIVADVSGLKHWSARCAVAFALPTLAECGQALGVPILGATYDPVDIIMYALGVGAAVAFDLLVLPRLFPFWRAE